MKHVVSLNKFFDEGVKPRLYKIAFKGVDTPSNQSELRIHPLVCDYPNSKKAPKALF
ncbi:hypothetical protein L1286_19690 [Pseudoalteromonas sp. SMS1]|uniref:hypothetical protein n=1 Tax=Pseudoalteromonas sp. SMS1 TaxID=2908894 RepID=UPI001F464818|nr:hypothetical protein [Pseudoalteromonas sp. SMS1]MCF2859706.1 hypothetical protein [Pseudoalteromonas sp. SMS1]